MSYKKILIPLDRSVADILILKHVSIIAEKFQSDLIFVHVADGFVARHQERMNIHD